MDNLGVYLLLGLSMQVCIAQSQYVVKQEPKPYCSFFNNRAPEPQPGLKNCTWFKDNSCCQQQEIAATFGRVKPLKGASPQCQKYINYLMCYICKPDQHLYYQNERLTVCREFCDSLYEACNSAVLKGSIIQGLYRNGTEFCRSRRFHVSEERCFTFDVTLDSASSSAQLRFSPVILVALCVSFFCGGRGMIATLVSAVMLLAAVGDCHVTSMYVGALASKLSQELNNLAEDGLQYRELQSQYDNAEYMTESINGTQKVLEIRNRLASFFTSKRILAENLASDVQKLHAEFVLSGEQELLREENLGHMEQLPLAQYLDTDLPHRLPIDLMTYDSNFKTRILANYSAIKIPDEVSRKNEELIETAVWTSRLDSAWRENLEKHPHIRWQYLASTTGLHRTYPAAEWPRNFIGFHGDFDPRTRPWYIAATSGPKNLVIIIDGSLSMAENRRLDRAKKVASYLLSTLSKQDYVAAVVSKSAVWGTDGQFKNVTSTVLHCHNSSLVPATSNNRKDLRADINEIVASGGSNHTEAFSLAYGLLRAHADDRCQNIIVFVTDGSQIPDGNSRCSKGYYRYNHDSKRKFVPGKHCFYPDEELLNLVAKHQVVEPARHFTFVVEKDDERLAGLLACRHGGVMARVVNNSDVIHQMTPYYTFLAGSLAARRAVWSSPYVDSSLLGLMTTVAVPVYSNLTDELLGVVGIDVPLSHLANKIRHSLWGSVYACLVDSRDGSAILHPFTKPITQGGDSPSFIPITYLETSEGLPKDFEKVLDGIKNKVVGDVKITKDARRATSVHNAFTWRPLPYSHYYFADIPESDFVILFHLTPSDKVFEHPVDPESSLKSYVHEINNYKKYANQIPDAYNELSPHDYPNRYPGLAVSTAHSVVSLAPRSFCFPSLYLEEGKPNFTEIHRYINLPSTFVNPHCPEGVFRSETRPDVKLTSVMENLWKKRSESIKSKITWTYIGTRSGVYRIYPGVQMTRNYDPTQRPWYTIAEVNKGRLAVSSPYLDNQHSDGHRVVTLSHTVHKGQTMTPPDCTVPQRDYGCPCTDATDCRSLFCYHGSCADEAIQAVVAMDIPYPDFSVYISEVLSKVDTVGKKCGDSYKCGQPARLCVVRCHLIDDRANFVTHPSLDEMSAINDRGGDISMASHYGYIMQHLIQKQVFIQKTRIDFQSVCRVSQSIPETLVLMTSSESDEEPGPIPAFRNEYSCTKKVVYYTHNRTQKGLVAGSLRDDPCTYEGHFFFTSIRGTNLFLLVVYDFHDLSRNAFNINCALSNRVSAHMSVKMQQRGCTNHPHFLTQPNKDDRVCYSAKPVDIDCGYNSSSSSVTPLLSFLIISSFAVIIHS